MTVELLTVVALLCQLHVGNTYYDGVMKMQKTCQKQLIACVSLRKKESPEAALGRCVVETK